MWQHWVNDPAHKSKSMRKRVCSVTCSSVSMCSLAVFIHSWGSSHSCGPCTLCRWRGWGGGWTRIVLVSEASLHCQSLAWKHMVDLQAHWATILTWHWLTHVERGRCEEQGRRGHPSPLLCHQVLVILPSTRPPATSPPSPSDWTGNICCNAPFHNPVSTPNTHRHTLSSGTARLNAFHCRTHYSQSKPGAHTTNKQ